MFRSNTAIGSDYTTAAYPQLIFNNSLYQPLKLFEETATTGVITGTQSFNGGTQTLILTILVLNLQDLVYIRGSGDLAGFFQVVNVQPNGFVIDTPFTNNQTGNIIVYGRFHFTTNITENMEVSVRGVGASELANGVYPGPVAFTSVFDNGGPDNNARFVTAGPTGNIVPLGRVVRIYQSFPNVYNGFLRVLGTPGAMEFVCDHQYSVSASGLWESAILTPVVKYTGTDTIKAVVEITLTGDDNYNFAVFLKTQNQFVLVEDSVSNRPGGSKTGERLTFTISELPFNAEIMIAFRPSALITPVNINNIRFGVYGVTASAGAISGVPYYQITQVNGGDPLIPGGTNFDGGNVPYPNIGDPVSAQDATNKQWVEARLPNIPNITYVKSEDDFGAIANIRGNPYHIVSQSTIFVISEPITLTNGGIGINTSGIKCSIVGLGKNESFINQLIENFGAARPLFSIEDMQNVQLSLQNLFIERQPPNAVDLFDVQTVNNINIYNEIYISNCKFSDITSGGTVNYNGASGKFMIDNCFFENQINGIDLQEISNVIISNNTFFNLNVATLDFFTFTNSLQSRTVCSNNRIISVNAGTYFANINNAASADSFYTLSNNDIRVAQYFNPAGLNETSPQVLFYSNTYIDPDTAQVGKKSSKYYEQVLIAVSTATTIPVALNTPLVVPLGPNQGSVTDRAYINANTLIINENGFYYLVARFNFGRMGNPGFDTCAIQLFLNGIPIENQVFTESLPNSDSIVRNEYHFENYLSATDQITFEIANITPTPPALDMGLIPFITNLIPSWIPPLQANAVAPSVELILRSAI